MDIQELINYGKYAMPLADAELLYQTASSINAKTIMEVGSANGCSSIILGTVAKNNNGIMQSVEHRVIPQWHLNIAHYGLTNHVKLINKPSPWVDSTDIITPLDYYLIDGCHTFRAATVDYHWGQYYVRKHGLIAFHDYHSPHNEVMPAITRILTTDTWLHEIGRSESGKGLIVFEKRR